MIYLVYSVYFLVYFFPFFKLQVGEYPWMANVKGRAGGEGPALHPLPHILDMVMSLRFLLVEFLPSPFFFSPLCSLSCTNTPPVPLLILY